MVQERTTTAGRCCGRSTRAERAAQRLCGIRPTGGRRNEPRPDQAPSRSSSSRMADSSARAATPSNGGDWPRPRRHAEAARSRVSERHAVIRVEGTNVVVADNGSQAGVFVNGERISARGHLFFDEISIGPFRLKMTSWARRRRTEDPGFGGEATRPRPPTVVRRVEHAPAGVRRASRTRDAPDHRRGQPCRRSVTAQAAGDLRQDRQIPGLGGPSETTDSGPRPTSGPETPLRPAPDPSSTGGLRQRPQDGSTPEPRPRRPHGRAAPSSRTSPSPKPSAPPSAGHRRAAGCPTSPARA